MDLKNLPPCLIEAADILRREWYSHMLPDSAEVLGFTRVRDVPDFERNLAELIRDAERDYTRACLTQGTLAQVAASDRVTHYRQAFAIATGTAVSGLEFNARLKRASEGL